MLECQHYKECANQDTALERLEFCLDDMERGSFRGCAYGFVKNDDTVYMPLREL